MPLLPLPPTLGTQPPSDTGAAESATEQVPFIEHHKLGGAAAAPGNDSGSAAVANAANITIDVLIVLVALGPGTLLVMRGRKTT